jgi:hypothetical protein
MTDLKSVLAASLLTCLWQIVVHISGAMIKIVSSPLTAIV